MKRRFHGKTATIFTLLIAAAAFFPAETQGGWYSNGNRGDCDGGLTRAQTTALSACELARARQLADLSCAELTRIAEIDRQGTNLRALAGYHRFPMRVTQPKR